MKHFYKILALSFLVLGLSISSCKEEKEKKVPPKKQVTKEVVKKEQPETVKQAPQPKPEPKEVKIPNKYFLILASFQDIQNAERLHQKLKDDGLQAEIHQAPNGFYRVSYKGFSNRKEAFKELRKERSTPEHQDVWLYIKG